MAERRVWFSVLTMPWEVGQRVALDGKSIVTIDRVTPSGQAVVGSERFDLRGFQIGAPWEFSRIEPLTPERETEVLIVERSRLAQAKAFNATSEAHRWLRMYFSVYDPAYQQDTSLITKAERLAAAIREILDEKVEGEET